MRRHQPIRHSFNQLRIRQEIRIEQLQGRTSQDSHRSGR